MALLISLTAFFTKHSSPKAVPAQELAAAVAHEAKAQNVDAKLIAQVIMVESRGVATATNKATKDHGIMQINERTAKHAKISQDCLKNWRCNLKAGVKLMKGLKRPCAYNLGNVGSQKWPKSCLKYEQKLAILN